MSVFALFLVITSTGGATSTDLVKLGSYQTLAACQAAMAVTASPAHSIPAPIVNPTPPNIGFVYATVCTSYAQ
jgi:hypothetical protein